MLDHRAVGARTVVLRAFPSMLGALPEKIREFTEVSSVRTGHSGRHGAYRPCSLHRACP